MATDYVIIDKSVILEAVLTHIKHTLLHHGWIYFSTGSGNNQLQSPFI
jgi:hypothetical protein